MLHQCDESLQRQKCEQHVWQKVKVNGNSPCSNACSYQTHPETHVAEQNPLTQDSRVVSVAPPLLSCCAMTEQRRAQAMTPRLEQQGQVLSARQVIPICSHPP